MKTLVVLIAIVCLGCASDSLEPSTNLYGTESPFGKWKFERFGDNEAFPYDVTLEVKNETNHMGQYQISGKAAVNFYYASFDIDVDKKTLVLYGIGSTKVAGDAQATSFEKKYYEVLVAANRYELSNNGETLTLFLSENKTQFLVFKKI